MKTTIKIFMLSFALVCAVTSCRKDDPQPVSQRQESASNTAAGDWLVDHLSINADDETSKFSAFRFSFNNDGTLVANDGYTTVSGKWEIHVENEDQRLTIAFMTSPFTKLNDDWLIVKKTPGDIALQNINGGNEIVHYLNFRRTE